MGYVLVAFGAMLFGGLVVIISSAMVAEGDERPRETLFRMLVRGIAIYTLFISVTKRTRRGLFAERVEQYLMRERTQLAYGYEELDRRRKESGILFPNLIKEWLDEVQSRQKSCDYAFGLALLAGYGKIAKKVMEAKVTQ